MRTRLLVLLIGLSLAPFVGSARQSILPTDFRLVALSSARVIVSIGGARQVLKPGQTTTNGVTLVAVDSGAATFEYRGKEDVITFDGMGASPPPAGTEISKDEELAEVILYAANDGFYHLDAEVNGQQMAFIVDTGATTVAMSSIHAAEIGLNLRGKKRGVTLTASGRAEMVRVLLDSVSVGGITIYDVPATVVLGEYPVTPLLGMSFLGKVDWRQEADRLHLLERVGFQ